MQKFLIKLFLQEYKKKIIIIITHGEAIKSIK